SPNLVVITIWQEVAGAVILTPPLQLARQPCCQTRHVLAFISFLGFSIVYALRVNLSVAMVVMVNHTSTSETINSKVCPMPWHNISQSAITQGWILGAFFYGYIVTQIPGGYLADRYGGKLLFGFGITCTWLFTLLTPIAAEMGVFYLILVRFVEGLGEGVTFPTMHSMWAKWAPPLERSQLISFSYAGSYFGTVIALPLSGVLADTLGWPYIFYICGESYSYHALHLFSSSDDVYHTLCSVDAGKAVSWHGFCWSSEKPQHVPWLEMSRSGPVWAICVSYFCYSWGFYTLLNCMPMYMNDILHFSIEEVCPQCVVHGISEWCRAFVCINLVLSHISMCLCILHGSHTLPEWQNVFYIASAVSVFGAVFFVLFGSGKIQKWAMVDHIQCGHQNGKLGF
uniref:Solute carrier family 17 member 5 n=1 Tax=Eptatretus burgeri TaxID=7764 RepID=A0A8C4Q3B3_EPTBU